MNFAFVLSTIHSWKLSEQYQDTLFCEGENLQPRHRPCKSTTFGNVSVRASNVCVSTLTWIRPSNLESQRLCKGKHNSRSKMGVKCCYWNLNFLQSNFFTWTQRCFDGTAFFTFFLFQKDFILCQKLRKGGLECAQLVNFSLNCSSPWIPILGNTFFHALSNTFFHPLMCCVWRVFIPWAGRRPIHRTAFIRHLAGSGRCGCCCWCWGCSCGCGLGQLTAVVLLCLMQLDVVEMKASVAWSWFHRRPRVPWSQQTNSRRKLQERNTTRLPPETWNCQNEQHHHLQRHIKCLTYSRQVITIMYYKDIKLREEIAKADKQTLLRVIFGLGQICSNSKTKAVTRRPVLSGQCQFCKWHWIVWYKLPSQRNAGAVCLLYLNNLNQNTFWHLYWQLWPDSLPGLNHPVLLALTTQACLSEPSEPPSVTGTNNPGLLSACTMWTTQCHWHWQPSLCNSGKWSKGDNSPWTALKGQKYYLLLKVLLTFAIQISTVHFI